MFADVYKVTLEDFGIVPSDSDGCLVLRLIGTGDAVAVEPLRTCLAAVEKHAMASDIDSVEFDIRRLQLLNSSCLKLFASFLLRLVASKVDCSVRFIVDARQAWQARSLFALERLAGAIVTVVPR